MMIVPPKKCRRRACDNLIHARCVAERRRRKFCSHRCNVLSNTSRRRKHGLDDPALRRTMRELQEALGVSGTPPLAFVRVVRHMRLRAYRAGWAVVTRKFRRAIARGILIHRRPGMAAL